MMMMTMVMSLMMISDDCFDDQGNADNDILSSQLNYFSREETPTSPSSPTAVLPPRKRKYSADENDHHLQVDYPHHPHHHHNRQRKYSYNAISSWETRAGRGDEQPLFESGGGEGGP